MESYVGIESWSFLDKLICQWRLEEEKVRSACGVDPAPDYGRCRLFRGQTPSKEWLISAGLSPPDGGNVQSLQPMATESPVVTQQAISAVAPETPVIANIDCSAYNVDYSRMCANSNTACCNDVRSDSDFCWDVYEKAFPGDLMSSACNHCCPDGPKTVGPPHPEKSGLPKTIQCSDVENPFRICGGCCVDPRSPTSYCNDVYEKYGDSLEEICVRTTVLFRLSKHRPWSDTNPTSELQYSITAAAYREMLVSQTEIFESTQKQRTRKVVNQTSNRSMLTMSFPKVEN